MATVKNGVYKVYNGLDYDEINFKTTAGNVSIVDANNKIVATDLEGALEEIMDTAGQIKLEDYDSEQVTYNGYIAPAVQAEITRIDGDISDTNTTISTTNVNLSNHIGDNIKHITSDERTTWNAKIDSVDYKRGSGYAVTTGTSTAYTITLNPAPTSYADGQQFIIVPHVDCGATPSLNVNGLGALTILANDGSTISAGDILANKPCSLVRVGSNFFVRSGGGIKINGFTTTSTIASGNTLSIGDEILFNNSEQIYKAKKLFQQTSSNTVVDSASSSSIYSLCSYPIDDTKVLLLYMRAEYLYARVLQVTSPTAIAVGSALVLSDDIVGMLDFNITVIDTTHIMVNWSEAGSSDLSKSNIISISGTTITKGTTYTYGTYSSVSCEIINSSSFIAILGGGSGVYLTVYAKVFNYSGTTISDAGGSSYTISDSVTGYNTAIKKIGNYFLIAYTSYTAGVQIFTISCSGTVITSYKATSCITGGGAYNGLPLIYCIDTSTALLIDDLASGSTVSYYTITNGNVSLLSSKSVGSFSDIKLVNNNLIYAVSNSGSGANVYSVNIDDNKNFTINGSNSISYYIQTGTFYQHYNCFSPIYKFLWNGNYNYCGIIMGLYQDSSNNKSIYGTIVREIKNAQGIALQSGTAGNTVKINDWRYN